MEKKIIPYIYGMGIRRLTLKTKKSIKKKKAAPKKCRAKIGGFASRANTSAKIRINTRSQEYDYVKYHFVEKGSSQKTFQQDDVFQAAERARNMAFGPFRPISSNYIVNGVFDPNWLQPFPSGNYCTGEYNVSGYFRQV